MNSGSTLIAAIEAAEDHKTRILGDDTPGLALGTDEQSQTIFGGFNIDHEELTEIANRAGVYFYRQSQDLGLQMCFSMCWVDAFLVGLFAASLPTANESGVTDSPDSEVG